MHRYDKESGDVRYHRRKYRQELDKLLCRCPYCPPHGGENSDGKERRHYSWKLQRRRQWKGSGRKLKAEYAFAILKGTSRRADAYISEEYYARNNTYLFSQLTPERIMQRDAAWGRVRPKPRRR